METKVLVVEDDFALRTALVASLEVSGYKIVASENAEAAIIQLSKTPLPDMVITDIQMAEMSGIDLLKHIRKNNQQLPVILMTAYGDISDAVEVMKLGACDYIQKPFEPENLTAVIEKYLPSLGDKEIINDPASIEVFNFANKIAATHSNVLLSGASGSGKEVMAKYIHRNSPRKNNKFVAINCAAIPENMLESTLFGYEKGAFTGAHQSMPGKFELAQGGTLLLDEISEMPLALQAKILRVIQEREVERLGGKKEIKLDVRVIATTNRDLKQEVKNKTFREDLYYRLNVFPIRCLSLHERAKDILPLAESLLKKYRNSQGLPELSFCAEAKAKLISYSWPGNVRELDNLIQRVAILAGDDCVQTDDIIFESVNVHNALTNNEDSFSESTSQADNQLGNDMRNHEYQLIVESLAKCNGKKKAVAEQLGISARTLRYKIAKMREAGYCIPDKKSFA
jgi:two-component system, response regulator FlrC